MYVLYVHTVVVIEKKTLIEMFKVQQLIKYSNEKIKENEDTLKDLKLKKKTEWNPVNIF